MAGRPRMMVKKLLELEQASIDLAKRVMDLMPAMYDGGEYDDGEDRIGCLWLELRTLTGHLPGLVNALTHAYQEKIGAELASPVDIALRDGDATWSQTRYGLGIMLNAGKSLPIERDSL